jgi:hypothetical protein
VRAVMDIVELAGLILDFGNGGFMEGKNLWSRNAGKHIVLATVIRHKDSVKNGCAISLNTSHLFSTIGTSN